VQFSHVNVRGFELGHLKGLLSGKGNCFKIGGVFAFLEGMCIRRLPKTSDQHGGMGQVPGHFQRAEDNGRGAIAHRAKVIQVERVSSNRVVDHGMCAVENALSIQRHFNMGIGIQCAHFLIFQCNSQQVLTGYAIFFHVQPGEHASHAGQGDPVWVLNLRVGHGGNKIGGAPACDLTHFFATHNQYVIVVTGCDGQKAVFDR